MRLMKSLLVRIKRSSKNDPELQNSLQCIENPIVPQRLKKLQQQDTNIEILKRKL